MAHSDLLTNLRVLGSYDFEQHNNSWAYGQFLNLKSLKEVQDMRVQLAHILSRLMFKPSPSSSSSAASAASASSSAKGKGVKRKLESLEEEQSPELKELNAIAVQEEDEAREVEDEEDEAESAKLFVPTTLESPPTGMQLLLLRQVIAAGFVDNVARKWPPEKAAPEGVILCSSLCPCFCLVFWPFSVVFLDLFSVPSDSSQLLERTNAG